MIDDLIAAMEKKGFYFHPPATEDEIAALISGVDCPIPDELLALYRRHNGMLTWLESDDLESDDPESIAVEDPGYTFRLMTIAEIREAHEPLSAYGWSGPERLCFATDDESNYLMIHTAGDLVGRCCILVHDDCDPSPIFRSLSRCLSALLAAGRMGFHFDSLPLRDYPPTANSDRVALAGDSRLAQLYRQRFEQETDDLGNIKRLYCARVMIALTPFEETDSLLSLTNDRDSYVIEAVCQSIGLRGYEPAIARLGELVESREHGPANFQTAAMTALGKIGSPAALQELLRLRKAGADSTRGYLFGYALRNCGCDILHRGWNLHLHYCLPNSTEWIAL